MSHRENYKEGVPSCTDLLKWMGYYKNYPNDEYYLTRGNAVEDVATAYLMGRTPDDRMLGTVCMAHAMPSGGLEQWMSYVDPFRDWMFRHKIKFIGAQIYICNPVETYQGTLDWLMWVDGKLTVTDLKTGTCLPCTKLQTAAYDMGLSFFLDSFTPEVKAAVRAWGLNKSRHRLGLQLEPGKCTPHEYDPKDYSRHNEDFRLLVRNWWKHGPASREYR